MAGKDDKRPIIIKKIKKGGHGHHGGAWKVAYADFVTAMMAFFLLLWLLSGSSKETLAGLAEYFTPTQGITSVTGISAGGGESPDLQGKKKSAYSAVTVAPGNTPSGIVSENPEKQAKSDSTEDDNLFKQGEKAIEQAFEQDATLQQYSENVSVSDTAEGLRIDITDSDKHAMFERSSATLTEHGRTILSTMAKLILRMPNFMAIYGNTDASPAETGRADYTNWELSVDRAQAARRFLTKAGIEAERTRKVIGMADRDLFTPKEPRGPKNRISLVLLRGSHILIPDSAVPARNLGRDAPVSEPAAPVAPPAPSAPVGH